MLGGVIHIGICLQAVERNKMPLTVRSDPGVIDAEL
jgi:hypothetical protein